MLFVLKARRDYSPWLRRKRFLRDFVKCSFVEHITSGVVLARQDFLQDLSFVFCSLIMTQRGFGNDAPIHNVLKLALKSLFLDFP